MGMFTLMAVVYLIRSAYEVMLHLLTAVSGTKRKCPMSAMSVGFGGQADIDQ